jgi:hypothetical protein
MGAICSSAQRVSSWLGLDDEHICRSINGLNLSSAEIAQLLGVVLIQEATKEGRSATGPLDEIEEEIGHDALESITDIEWLKRVYGSPTESLEEINNYSAIIRPSELPYWTRLWVVQQVALAQDIVLLSGAKTRSWATVRAMFF